jgi:hypothetical protein
MFILLVRAGGTLLRKKFTLAGFRDGLWIVELRLE